MLRYIDSVVDSNDDERLTVDGRDLFQEIQRQNDADLKETLSQGADLPGKLGTEVAQTAGLADSLQGLANRVGLGAAGMLTDNPTLYDLGSRVVNAATGADENSPFALGKQRIAANLLQRFASGRGTKGMTFTKEEGKGLYEAFTTSPEIEDLNARYYPNIPTTNIGGQEALDENTAAGFRPYSGGGSMDGNVAYGFGRFWATKPGDDGAIIVKDQFDGVGEDRSQVGTLDIQDVAKDPTRIMDLKGASNKPIPIKMKIYPDGRVEMID